MNLNHFLNEDTLVNSMGFPKDGLQREFLDCQSKWVHLRLNKFLFFNNKKINVLFSLTFNIFVKYYFWYWKTSVNLIKSKYFLIKIFPNLNRA